MSQQLSIEYELFRDVILLLQALREERREIKILLEEFMSTTNTGLAALQAAVAALSTAQGQVIADVQKLLAGQTGGPQPGQVIVNQSDIDALTSSIQALTAADVAADVTVNPPPAQ